ncbi:selenocysteine-specific translation elongation factor [Nocardioides solisilvae]|uniref:selenocysteine-specific translation elongation factor n=1 Tax=Nocardioides solisilvae TaxID=1542435 RepID=UPI000D7449B7|nr:selenocysteine-specific translation elongation factor [Nocardioides solisilvae]
MHVVATAGHVDHGKSTLVDALTGMRSDRLEEERRRGLSIELGYVWTSLPGLGDVAFVDVPGHERFISTMLSGIGPVPAALLVVAADDPWMPQAAEHLAALDAVGVRHGVVAVTRSDLADPAPAAARAAAEVARTSLRDAPVVPVSARTGAGLDDLRAALSAVLARLPEPDAGADVRLWVDRRFTVRGAGTVVTGTLPAGRVARGDELAVGGARVRVRGVQALGAPVEAATGVARVALNVVGDDLEVLDRGAALVTPDAFQHSDVVDVRVAPDRSSSSDGTAGGTTERWPAHLQLHVGAASVPARLRPLGPGVLRLVLERPLPLRVGDRALLRDPGSRAVHGVRVLDPAPPTLRRRGAAAALARQLAGHPGEPDLAHEVARRGLVPATLLRRLGVPGSVLSGDPPAGTLRAAGWWLSAARAARVAGAAAEAVAAHDAQHPLDRGVPLVALAERLSLPHPGLLAAALAGTSPAPLVVRAGRVLAPDAAGASSAVLPPAVERAVRAVEADLGRAAFAAPTADRLAELGLDGRGVAAAERAGRLLRVAPGIVLLPGADRAAAGLLVSLPQPFTTSEARQRLGTTRRVVLPLLDLLDRRGLTRRHPDDRREVVSAATA